MSILYEIEMKALCEIAEVARFFRSYRTIDIIQKKLWELELRMMEYHPRYDDVSPCEAVPV